MPDTLKNVLLVTRVNLRYYFDKEYNQDRDVDYTSYKFYPNVYINHIETHLLEVKTHSSENLAGGEKRIKSA